ncbi:MAG: hypothetical protein ACRDYX_06825, partial [Egibacteraceae bacterium]
MAAVADGSTLRAPPVALALARARVRSLTVPRSRGPGRDILTANLPRCREGDALDDRGCAEPALLRARFRARSVGPPPHADPAQLDIEMAASRLPSGFSLRGHWHRLRLRG